MRFAIPFAVAILVAGCGNGPQPPTGPGPIVEPPPVVEPPPPPPPPTLGVTRVLAFGDSLTEGESLGLLWGLHDPSTPGVSRSYPFKLQRLLSDRYTGQTITVYNGGFGGKNAREDGPRLRTLLAQFQPEVVILLEGVNDLNGGDAVPSGDVLDALRLMARDAKASGARMVLLCTLPPQREGGSRAFSYDRIVNFNAQLPNIARLEDVTLVDIYPLFDPALPAGDLTPDGLHLTEQGNQKLAQTFFDIIRSSFETAAAAAGLSH